MGLLRNAMGGSILGKVLVMGVLPVALIGGAVTGVIALRNNSAKTESINAIKREVTITYGTPLTVDLFAEPGADVSGFVFASDVTVIDTNELASYELSIINNGYKAKSLLNIVDDVAPTAEAVPQTIYVNQLPDPNKCVTNIQDKSEVTVTYADDVDAGMGGPRMIGIVLTDYYGNKTVIDCPFDVIDDHTAPVITGCQDITIIVGDTPMYRKGIEVTDDYDMSPKLTIDNSQVNLDEVGSYPLIYIAEDECGNCTTVEVTVNVVEEEVAEQVVANGGTVNYGGGNWHKYDNCTAADAYAAASKIYGGICKSSQSDVLRGLKIFYWVNHNIGFALHHTTHASWAAAACQAYGRRYASCYGQWAACKALLDVAGIPNRKVWRNNGNHIWCLCYLNGGWYHCDSTQYPGAGHTFSYMMTDSEIRKAIGHHKGFNTSSLPARATTSVQKYINIYKCTVSSSLKLVTPTPTPIPTSEAAPSSSASSATAAPTGSSGSTAAPTTAAPTASPETQAPASDTATPTETPVTQAPPTEAPKTPDPQPQPQPDPEPEGTGD